jgi:hypothetical protein
VTYDASEFSLPFLNKEEMNLIKLVYIVAALSIVYLIWNHYSIEHMSNKDLQDKEEHNATKPKDWKGAKHPTGKKPNGQPIQGPRAPQLDPNQPDPSDGGGGKNGSGVYPDIYGPDSLLPPGHKDIHLQGESTSDPPPYDYVPAAEFPAGPAEPAPYLNDFSTILKYN